MAFSTDKAPRLAAALAYYTIFAIAPLLFLIIVIAGTVLGEDQIRQFLVNNLPSGGGEGAANGAAGGQGSSGGTQDFINGLLQNVQLQEGSTWATLLGLGTLFFASTGLFANLKMALNDMWGAKPPDVSGVWNLVRTRLIAFALVVLVAVVILAYMAGNTVLTAFASTLGDTIGFGAFFARLATFLLGIGLFSVVFAMIYRYLPDVDLSWREVWTGAIITAVLFTIGQLLISLYFGRVSPGSVFGAAGSLVVLLLWVYYSSMILFYGAEITWVYSQKFGTQPGGATNPQKKAAVADKGGEVPTGVSAKEQEDMVRSMGSRQRGPVLNDARSALLLAPHPRVPGPGQALLRALLAVLALPALAVFRGVRLVEKTRKRHSS